MELETSNLNTVKVTQVPPVKVIGVNTGPKYSIISPDGSEIKVITAGRNTGKSFINGGIVPGWKESSSSKPKFDKVPEKIFEKRHYKISELLQVEINKWIIAGNGSSKDIDSVELGMFDWYDFMNEIGRDPTGQEEIVYNGILVTLNNGPRRNITIKKRVVIIDYKSEYINSEWYDKIVSGFSQQFQKELINEILKTPPQISIPITLDYIKTK